jgi:hypothetical protein
VALGLTIGAAAAARPAQAQPVLRFPANLAAVSWGDNQNDQLGNGNGSVGEPKFTAVPWGAGSALGRLESA